MKKTLLVLLTWLTISLLVACSNDDSKYIEKHLQIISQATETSKQNVLFNELHVEEQQLYDKIIEGGKESNENVKTQMNNAISLINKSKEIVEYENNRLSTVTKQLQETDKLLSKIRKNNKNSIALTLDRTYRERMKLYQKALHQYDNLLSKEQELYTFLQNGTDLKEVSQQVDRINTESKKVYEVIKKFNEATETYNQISKQI